MEIRPAEERDRLPMARLVAAVAEERTGIGSEPPVDIEARAARFDLDASFVAVEADRVVGLIHLHELDDGRAELGMMVAKDHRRKGVGRLLLVTGADWARGRRLRALELDVFSGNAAAIALYRGFGFVEDGRTRAIVRQSGEVWDAIGMSLSL